MKSPRLITKLRAPSETTPGAPSETTPGGPSNSRLLRIGRDTTPPLTFWLKAGQALCLAVAVCFSLGATDASSRYNDLSHKTMCTCSCAQILGECNHVGCSASTEELGLVRDGINGGQTDQQILDSMVAKYGAVVLAAPTKQGFDVVAWIAPVAVFLAGLLGTILLVRHWSVGRTQPAPVESNPEMDAIREKIRRETGAEGGN